jgi:putative membrane protein (TIGR04086 family)
MPTSARRPAVQHREVAREAGFGRLSLLSTLAGTMCAFGTAAIAGALAAAIISQTDVDLTTDDFTSSGFAAALLASAVLFLAALFGGYVAGRMARRSGLLHGVAVVVATFLVGAVLAAVGSLAEGLDLRDDLQGIGIPTAWDQVRDVALGGALVAAAMIVVGAVLGGVLGERWHTKLVRRVDDPAYGPAADERARVEAEALRRRQDDELVRAEADEDRLRRTPPADDRVLTRDERHEGYADERLPGAQPEHVDLRDRPVVTEAPPSSDEASRLSGRRR